MQIWMSPVFLGTNTAGAIQGLLLSVMMPWFNISWICFSTFTGFPVVMMTRLGFFLNCLEEVTVCTMDCKLWVWDWGNSYFTASPNTGITLSLTISVCALFMAVVYSTHLWLSLACWFYTGNNSCSACDICWLGLCRNQASVNWHAGSLHQEWPGPPASLLQQN